MSSQGYLSPPLLGALHKPTQAISMGRRYFGLDVLRTAAIFLVLLQHAGGNVATLSKWLSPIHTFGYFGVELFFVLSGFLIGTILLKPILLETSFSGKDLLGFWVRRWLRTLPNYYLFVIFYFTLAVIQSVPIPNPLSYLFFMQNLNRDPPNVFSVSWSLAIEEWFYILLPIGCYISLKIFRRTSAILFPIGFFLVVPTFLRAFVIEGGNWIDCRRMVVFRMDALMYGVIAAYLFQRFPEIWSRMKKVSLLGVVFLIISLTAILHNSEGESSLWFRTLIYSFTSIGFTLLLPWFCDLPSPGGPWERVFTFFSVCSYSAYLVHPEMQIPFNALWNQFAPGPLFLPLKFVAWMCLVWSVSSIIYRHFERPFMALRDRFPCRSSES